MFAHTPVRRLYQPRIEPCWDCGDRKVAIAYQVKILYGHTHYRWFCQECGRSRRIYPTQELLARIQRQQKRSGQKATVVAFPSQTSAISTKA